MDGKKEETGRGGVGVGVGGLDRIRSRKSWHQDEKKKNR